MIASNNGRRQVARARGRVRGVRTTAGAFLTFGLIPLTATPSANADIGDVVADPVVTAITSALTGATDALAGLDPAAGLSALDLGTAGLDTGAVSAAAADLAGSSASASAVSDSATAASFDSVLHTLEQEWITSAAGIKFDDNVNTLWTDFGGSGMLIGDGPNGVDGGTLAEATGGNGGLLFGDGGNGATDAAGVGGAGGAAGLYGDGGDGGAGADGGAGGAGGAGGTVLGDGGNGGNGGEGVTGGAGGDGGAATGLFDNGGNGGDGGDGTGSGVLPALGGAGGNGGVFGDHGAAGGYGTIAGESAPTSTQAAIPDNGTNTDVGAVLPLTTTGTYLTDSTGQVVLLHGTNLVIKVPPYTPEGAGFNSADAQFLSENGFNAVRLGIDWAALEPEPGVYDTSYLASIESTVQTLHQDGIVSILDVHQDGYSTEFGGEGAPAWATESNGAANPALPFPYMEFFNPAETQAWDSFWSNSDAPNGIGLEDDYSQMLQYLASAFNGNPAIAGIEIMNEPSPGSDTLSTLLGSQFFDAQELTPFYDQASSAIRSVDPTTPIFFEPDAITTEGLPIGLGTVNATGTVLSFHDYTGASSVQNALEYAQAHDIPAFMTEFGATDNQATIGSIMDDANKDLTGWTEWAFTGQNDITTTASPSSIESLVYDLAQAPTGDNVNTATLETLASPYPQVISGTPDSYSFANGVFQFSYSTEAPDGLGSFAAGSQTTISVPAVEFPHGYAVAVTGGEVVSAPNAAELVIASDSGASTVSVTVSPTT